jgi:hypothetical protein
LSGGRLPASYGIVIGGALGAIAALVGITKTPSSETPPLPTPQAPQSRAKHPPAPDTVAPSAAATAAAPSALPSSADTNVPAAVSAPAATAAAAQPPGAAAGAPKPSPALELPTTRDSLLAAEMLCDRRKNFDECARAAGALEKGTAGPVDLEQAKRFKRMESTFLVMQCEGGMPHACLILANKYRTGTDVVANEASAAALEKRGLELCKTRPAPECP